MSATVPPAVSPSDPAEISAQTADAAAALLGLTIPADQRASVLLYLRLAADMAAQVNGLALTPADESANVFRPIAAQDPT